MHGGLFLPRFKMPDHCENCPCSSEYYDSKWDEYDLNCSLTGECVDVERFGDFKDVEKPDNCPLIYFPKNATIIIAEPGTFPTLFRDDLNDYMKGWNACLRSVMQSALPEEKE